jgi:hypothetical protein
VTGVQTCALPISQGQSRHGLSRRRRIQGIKLKDLKENIE